jgi:YbgC/YbaW family acyl-CoA thioester hydrolase
MNFLEEARKWFLAQYGFNLKEMFARDLGFIVTRYEIDYKLSLVAGEEFVIETSMEQISRVQVKFMLKTLKKQQKDSSASRYLMRQIILSHQPGLNVL